MGWMVAQLNTFPETFCQLQMAFNKKLFLYQTELKTSWGW